MNIYLNANAVIFTDSKKSFLIIFKDEISKNVQEHEIVGEIPPQRRALLLINDKWIVVFFKDI